MSHIDGGEPFGLRNIGRKTMLGDTTYEILKEAITEGRFPPGSWLPQKEITRALGISRTPLREVLKRLHSEGLVEIVPRKGAFIATVDKEDVKHLFEAREVIETTFLVRGAKNIPRKDMERFQHMFRAAEERIQRARGERNSITERMSDYLAVDREFHRALIEAARNPYWTKLYQNIRDKMQVFGYRMTHMPDQLPRLCEQHNGIVQAVLEEDFSMARRKMRDHIRYVKSVFVNIG